MNESVISIKKLSKRYPGVQALDNIDLEFPKGMISGLVGPNGSGKTTLLKIIADLAKKDSGEVEIKRKDINAHLMEDIAFLPEINHLYKWMTIKEAVNFYSAQFKDFSEAKAEEILDFMNLKKEQKIKSLSKGMAARLKLVLNLGRSAPILLLDEPLAGIDPASRGRILESLIGEFDSENQSIILSTHEVIEAEKFFDYVVFLDEGNVVLSGNADDLRAEKGQSIRDLVGEVFQ